MSEGGWDEVTTADEFEAALGSLLITAARNGVEPRGSWVYRNGDTRVDWEVLVHELEPSGETDD